MPDSTVSNGPGQPRITVIIPTVADERRAATIWRAIASAGTSSGAATRILVVVNGGRYSPSLLEELRASPMIECVLVERGSLPLALREGRKAVRTEYFAFLDDDDEFLAGGLGRRLAAMTSQASAAFLISQGWFHSNGRDMPQTSIEPSAINSDPLGTLLRENWVATSASGLYRTSAIDDTDFAEMPHFLEWTYLGFRLAARHRFIYFEEPTYRRYDMPGSVSKSRAYQEGLVPALQGVLMLDLPATIKRALRAKLGSHLHDVSALALESGDLASAWRHHCKSLALPGGLRFLLYTRHLILPALANVGRS